jgi:hypothetical protein
MHIKLIAGGEDERSAGRFAAAGHIGKAADNASVDVVIYGPATCLAAYGRDGSAIGRATIQSRPMPGDISAIDDRRHWRERHHGPFERRTDHGETTH